MNQELNIYNYAVSHDLKAPLQIISLSSELLRKSSFDKLTDREKEDLSQISQSIKNMKKLIDELLMLSQIDKAQKKITLVNINEVIAEIQEEIKAAETTNVPKFVFHNLPVVTCQRTLIKQLFLNLIANGIKYNRSDEPTIWINYEDHYDYHQFSVKDNGIGINADNYERVFEPFKRLHPREEFPGTGVGLVICKKIIETFHGKIWLESKPDIGSTFFITIPKKLIQGEDRGDLLNPASATEGSDP
jgi:light-regulated signal transduction histidine kinase (bacteriophytochrome)